MTARKLANDQDFNGRKGINLGAPSGDNDTGRKIDIDDAKSYAISRANHTGTQLAATISDFNAAVRLNRIDQLANPTGSVSLNSQKIISLADPTSAQEAATKNYVDTAVAGLTGGLQFKGTVKAASNTNVNLASPGTAVFDGITLTSGVDIVLLTGQTTGSQNGPYLFNGSGSTMTRAANWDTSGEAQVGSFWVVQQGTQADSFAIMTNDTFTLATTTAVFQYVGVAPSATLPFEADLGDASSTSFNCDHNFGTKAVLVTVFRNASPYDEVTVYVARPTTNRVTIEPDETWSTAQFHVVISKA